MSQSPQRPISIGNVVSIGFVLYRSHLKIYLQLALTAYLWALVPVYGWAKYAAIHGLISRLAYGELVSQPETVSTARSKIKPRLWSFLGVPLRIGLALLVIDFGLVVLVIILSVILGTSLTALLGQAAMAIVAILSGIVTIVIMVIGIIRLICRWILAEVILAVEENINAAQSIDRSWELTKSSVGQIQGVFLVAFLLTIPLLFLTNFLPQIFLLRISQDSYVYWIVYFISWSTSFLGGVVVMPFWPAIKAVIYYDLRSWQEGLGLQLREREASGGESQL